MEASVTAGLTGCRVLTSEITDVSGFPAHLLDFRWTAGPGDLRRVQLAVLNGAESLLLACTGLEAGFDGYEPLFRRAAASLRIEAR